jgi:sulfide:quinone oxidoreductase
LTLVTPLPGAFTKPRASQLLGTMLEDKNIKVIPEFMVERVEPDQKKLISYEEEEVP